MFQYKRKLTTQVSLPKTFSCGTLCTTSKHKGNFRTVVMFGNKKQTMLTRIESCMFENKSLPEQLDLNQRQELTLLCQIKLYSEIYRRRYELSAVFVGGIDSLDAKSKRIKTGVLSR